MAKTKSAKAKDAEAKPPQPKDALVLIEITRHIGSPIRRAPGQRLWLTARQLAAQGLVEDRDYRTLPIPAPY